MKEKGVLKQLAPVVGVVALGFLTFSLSLRGALRDTDGPSGKRLPHMTVPGGGPQQVAAGPQHVRARPTTRRSDVLEVLPPTRAGRGESPGPTMPRPDTVIQAIFVQSNRTDKAFCSPRLRAL